MNKIKKLVFNGENCLVGYDKDGNITMQSPLQRFTESEEFLQIFKKFIEEGITDGTLNKYDPFFVDILQGKKIYIECKEIHKHFPDGGITVTGNFVSTTKTTAKIIPFHRKEKK